MIWGAGKGSIDLSPMDRVAVFTERNQCHYYWRRTRPVLRSDLMDWDTETLPWIQSSTAREQQLIWIACRKCLKRDAQVNLFLRMTALNWF